ncbi:MAG TPA: histidine kinase [Pseudonocardiaceae bacterium]|jgi:signal transduction histidine kinase
MARTAPQSRLGIGPLRRLPVFVLPALLALFQVQATRFAAMQQPDRAALNGVAFALLLAGPVVLVARRRHPVAVLAAVLALTVTYFALNFPYGPVFLSAVLALVGAMRGHRRAAWVLAGSAYVALLVVQALPGGAPSPSLPNAAGIAAWLLVVLLACEGLRIRTERRVEAERSRAEQDRRRASDERLQIARELHDVLAHNISLINVQASVALHLLDDQPDAARSALGTIKQASKDVLTEMRSVLGVLRGVDEAAPRLPAPSLSRLEELVARSGDAGLALHTEVHGTPVPLAASVDVAAYRILQEALTNAARHGRHGAGARASITYAPGALTVQVDNETSDAPPSESAGTALTGTGNGIAGMRERVSALGGRFSAAPLPGTNQFRVLASFPLETSGSGNPDAAQEGGT